MTEKLAADTIRVLAMDAVQKANSGHPGMPMGMADIATVLWGHYLKVDPQHPMWPDRDRFVVSNGHGSMLLYALLHLSGFDITMHDIENFRQWGSPTPGHPEVDHHRGIETTTGPLGQGFGTAVGMALAEAHLNARFGDDLVDHNTYVFCSDGDLMEGITSEAASLAGHWRLGKLVAFYDDNAITLEGPAAWTLTENVVQRFEAYGWHTVTVDGHDRAAVSGAIDVALAATDRPTLIDCKTHIGFGSPAKQDTASAHGSPLGEEEVSRTREALGWELAPFHVPGQVYDFFHHAMERGQQARSEWERRLDMIGSADGALASAWHGHHDPQPVKLAAPSYEPGKAVATRAMSGAVIQQLCDVRPDVLTGEADLAGSTKSEYAGAGHFASDDRSGRNVRYGVREHAMGAIVNGITLHGGLRAFGSTFLTFSDYMRGAVRLSALMELPSVWVWSHDSVFLGEDGPTHQPVEHLAALRAIPNLWVVRPATPGEVAGAWQVAVNRLEGPTAIVLSRQNVPVPDEDIDPSVVAEGAYVARRGGDAVVVATGSELSVALAAAGILEDRGVSLRVVSMPCVEAFAARPDHERSAVLGEGLPVASLEAAATFGWAGITGPDGCNIGIDHFGESAPWEEIAERLGLTAEAVAERLAAWLSGR
jgi:transketolase